MASDDRQEAIRTFGVFGRSRDILAEYILQGEVPAASRDYLAADALTYLDRAREGYRWLLRAPGLTDTELRRVVRPFDLPVTDPHEPVREWALLVPNRQVLVASNIALIVISWVPKLPTEAITYPGWARRTYADIAAPASPSEFFERLEDLERIMWSVAGGVREAAATSLRRAYAFFESGFWLTQQFRPRGTR